jgi:anti-sigma regulatory factor (Ser/Thr protein kinase)
MRLSREKQELLRKYILEHIESNPRDVVRLTAGVFDLTRQAVINHMKLLSKEGLVLVDGRTRSTVYTLKEERVMFSIPVNRDLKEDVIWTGKVAKVMPSLEKNIYDICYYGFTEMLNNVIDHSGSDKAEIVVRYNAVNVKLMVMDFGVGIFAKIQKDFGLESPKHAILELAKGKLTSDPERHTGEGIFFTSRVFDAFDILSQDLYFHGQKDNDWLLESKKNNNGTAVFMEINRDSKRTLQGVFDEYSPMSADYGFARTKVPVELMRHEGEELVSRSQAKRLIMRFNKFKEVILDFEGVKTIGQPFADEVFRVFRNQNPEVNLTWVNTSEEVEKMIRHVLRVS